MTIQKKAIQVYGYAHRVFNAKDIVKLGEAINHNAIAVNQLLERIEQLEKQLEQLQK